jgi:Cdc6-like AAA superfamily ATPase
MVLSNSEKINLSYQAAQVFTPATAVDERDLFGGRIPQIKQLVQLMGQRGQHAIIFGERGVGKTSFANVATDFLLTPTSIIKPHINCSTRDTFNGIWKRVFSQIEVTKEKQAAGFQQVDASQRFTLADTYPGIIRADQVEEALSRLADSGNIVLVILDEFDRIDNTDVRREIADLIKSMSDRGHPATIVIVGVADTVTDLISEHQSVERALVQIQMPRMSTSELEEIVNKALPRINMTIAEDALTQICFYSRGFPHFTHKLALYAAIDAIENDDSQITLQHVDAGIDRTVNDAQYTHSADYAKAIYSSRKAHLFRQVLLACALAQTDELGYFPASAVSGPLSAIMGKPYDVPSFARHLKEFCDPARGPILQRIGEQYRGRFRFANPMMQPFVAMKGFADGMLKPIQDSTAANED